MSDVATAEPIQTSLVVDEALNALAFDFQASLGALRERIFVILNDRTSSTDKMALLVKILAEIEKRQVDTRSMVRDIEFIVTCLPLPPRTVEDWEKTHEARVAFQSDLIANLKALMRDLGFTQTDIARAIDIDQTTLSRVLNGQRLGSLDVIRKLAKWTEETYTRLSKPR